MIDRTAKLSDADKAVDFTEVIQGHVGASVRQVFTIERTRDGVEKRLNMPFREHVVKDQFGNLYVVFTAKLLDGEMHACVAWIGSEKWTDRGKEIVLVKEWKKFRTFDDSLLAACQGLAVVAFGRENLAIIKARHAASLPLQN